MIFSLYNLTKFRVTEFDDIFVIQFNDIFVTQFDDFEEDYFDEDDFVEVNFEEDNFKENFLGNSFDILASNKSAESGFNFQNE